MTWQKTSQSDGQCRVVWKSRHTKCCSQFCPSQWFCDIRAQTIIFAVFCFQIQHYHSKLFIAEGSSNFQHISQVPLKNLTKLKKKPMNSVSLPSERHVQHYRQNWKMQLPLLRHLRQLKRRHDKFHQMILNKLWQAVTEVIHKFAPLQTLREKKQTNQGCSVTNWTT